MPEYWLDDEGRPLCCPPHNFDVVWLGPDDSGRPALFCKLCGEAQEITITNITAPIAEQIRKDTGEPT